MAELEFTTQNEDDMSESLYYIYIIESEKHTHIIFLN